MTKAAAPTVAAAAVAAIMADILSPGRVPRPRCFRVPLTGPTVCMKQMTLDAARDRPAGEYLPTNDWLRTEGMSLYYKIAHSKDSECTELLDVFSPANALHVKYPLSPVKIYGTKQEVDMYKDRLDFINITEIGEAQAMMEMVRYEYINNLDKLSTDSMRIHMDTEFWYQQHNLD
jgi:hypothetical protein